MWDRGGDSCSSSSDPDSVHIPEKTWNWEQDEMWICTEIKHFGQVVRVYDMTDNIHIVSIWPFYKAVVQIPREVLARCEKLPVNAFLRHSNWSDCQRPEGLAGVLGGNKSHRKCCYELISSQGGNSVDEEDLLIDYCTYNQGKHHQINT